MTLAEELSRTARGRGSLHVAQRAALALGLALALGGVASEAHATPEYPLILQQRLDPEFDGDCPTNSRCLVCHLTARGGQATAVRPFAQTLRMYGLTRGRDGAALIAALGMLPADTDSDDDGITDLDELSVCGNPSGGDLGGGPVYGCDGAHLAPTVATENVPLGIIALLATSLFVRRRR
jgi:hypothetical protein